MTNWQRLQYLWCHGPCRKTVLIGEWLFAPDKLEARYGMEVRFRSKLATGWRSKL